MTVDIVKLMLSPTARLIAAKLACKKQLPAAISSNIATSVIAFGVAVHTIGATTLKVSFAVVVVATDAVPATLDSAGVSNPVSVTAASVVPVPIPTFLGTVPEPDNRLAMIANPAFTTVVIKAIIITYPFNNLINRVHIEFLTTVLAMTPRSSIVPLALVIVALITT
jgi:hypothetical protein